MKKFAPKHRVEKSNFATSTTKLKAFGPDGKLWIMASKAIKLVAKYNTLRLIAQMLEHHCSSDVFEDIDGVPGELIEQVDK